MIRPLRKLSSPLMMVLLAAVAASCTPGHYSKSAHRETVGILDFKRKKVPNSGSGLLDITPPAPPTLTELEQNLKTVSFLGESARIEKGAKVLKLADALRYGVHRNRDYLEQKESLYLQALDLTLERHQFAPIFSAVGAGSIERKRVEAGVNRFVTESTQTFDGAAGFSLLGKAGTRIAADLTTDFFRLVTGQMNSVSDSELAVTLSQPLLRGAGYLAVTESLTQAERDMLYAIRDFTQFRKTFAVDLTSQYFRTLQARDTAKNAFLAYEAFKQTVERERGMQEANKRTLPSLLQIDQAVLTYHRRWLAAINSYENEVDDLKIQLGIPVSERIMLDEGELAKLTLIDPPGSLDSALATAHATRLDLWNARDSVLDADRKVKVAKQDLLPSLNAFVDYRVSGNPKSDQVNLNAQRRTTNVGIAIDPRLDKKEDRNTLRSSEVRVQSSTRSLDLAEENVRRQIRGDWRDLELARRQYDLAVQGLALSERRLEVETAFFKEDKTTSARDLIDAQQDLIEARDLMTATLINHTIARLNLWKDMGILFITKDGGWADVLKNEKPAGAEE